MPMSDPEPEQNASTSAPQPDPSSVESKVAEVDSNAVRKDRRVGLLIVGVAFLASCCVSWWANNGAQPQPPRAPAPPSAEGLLGFPSRVDPVAVLPRARERSDRDLLRGMVAVGVAVDGTVDFKQAGSRIRFVFQSSPGEGPQPVLPMDRVPTRAYCGRQNIHVKDRGMFADKDQPRYPCVSHGGPLPEPRCTTAGLWNEAVRRGVPKNGRARIEYYRAKGGPAWRFELPGTNHRFTVYGDCERELKGQDAYGSVP